MLSRLRLPANQFSKCLVQQMSRAVHGVYTTPTTKFLPSRVPETKQFEKFIDCTRDLRLPPRFRTTASIETSNTKTDSLDSLFFLKNNGITKLLDDARKADGNPIYTTPLSTMMRPISKMAVMKENDIPPEDVETDLYDVQHVMEPSYQEHLYQVISQRQFVMSQEYDNSGPVLWNIIR